MEDKKTITYRPDIDGLRALAVLLVIAFHALPSVFPGGFIGVDMFFVISGFLITGIILKMLRNNEFSYIRFYERRVRRLFPALITVLLSCLLFGYLFLFSQEYSILGKHVFSGASFISNIIYFLETSYFDISSSLKPLVHLWSLGVEEQFYVFWPVLLVFLYRKSKKLSLMMGLILLFSFILNIFIGFNNPKLAFYLSITRFWEFLSGAIIANISFSENSFFRDLIDRLTIFKKKKFFSSSLISWFGFLLILISLFIINHNNFYKGYVVILVAGVSLLILSGTDSFINRKIFSNKILVFIGLISYPLYLWHWSLFSFAKIIIGKETTLFIKLPLIFLSFILACATYTFIEKPLRYSKNKATTIILCLSMVFVAVLGSLVYLSRGLPFRFKEQESLLKTVSLSPSYKIFQTRSSLNGEGVCKKIYPQEIYNRMCMVKGDSSNKVFIIGDSHARTVFEGYKSSLVNKGYSLINLGISGCPFPIPENIKRISETKHCNQDINLTINTVINENPRAIIISNNALYYNPEYKYFEFGMDKFLSRLPSNVPIIWILQTPKVPFSLTKCLSRNIFLKQGLINCSFSRTYFNKRLITYNETINSLKGKYPNLILVDPAEALCQKNKCNVVIDNNYVYEDLSSHLSVFGSQYVAERLPIDQYLPDLKK